MSGKAMSQPRTGPLDLDLPSSGRLADMRVAELLLRGAGGEPVDFARTIVSHGVAELPPNRVELASRTLESTLPVPGGARTVRLTHAGERLRVDVVAGATGARTREALAATVAHMFRLDEDLSASTPS
jgi:hypothetical protein